MTEAGTRPDARARPLVRAAIEAAFVLRAAPRAPGALKADGSPVTPADLAADRAIRACLARLLPDLPVVSEEGEGDPPAAGAEHVCVDPLDGTREFLAGSDEFAVNLALIRDGAPVCGVVAAPAWGVVWAGAHAARFAEPLLSSAAAAGGGAPPPRSEATLAWRALPRTAPEGSPEALAVAVSRRHGDRATDAFVASLPAARRLELGSALKFCRVADGTAALYPRFGPTMGWDTAAGQAVLEAAGGAVLDLEGRVLRYRDARAPNPPFVALGPGALSRRDAWLAAARAAGG